MASPVNDSYSCLTGGSIYAGRQAVVPAWLAAQTVNTWTNIPGAAFSTYNPELSALINPNYPGTSPWHTSNGFPGKNNAWCGAAWDDSTATFWKMLDGGHADWAGNEPFKVCLNADTLSWSMLRYPSDSVGNVITLNDGADNTNFFTADGRLRPGHSYNNNIYVPGIGPLVTRQEYVCFAPGSPPAKVFKINETTGEATLLCDYSSLGASGIYGSGTGGATYDASRNCLWVLPTGAAALFKINLNTNVGTIAKSQSNLNNGYARPMYIPGTDVIAVFHNGGGGYIASKFYLIDVANGFTIIQPSLTGTPSAGLTQNGQTGMDWDGTRLLFWNNATNRTEISTLTPNSDPRVAWVWGTLTVDGSNAVTPTAATSTGTYGRFGYSSKLKGCYLHNAVSDAMSFFKMA